MGEILCCTAVKNRESRGRRPRLSTKEEKKRFRPSVSQHTCVAGCLLGASLTPVLRKPYGEMFLARRWYCGPRRLEDSGLTHRVLHGRC